MKQALPNCCRVTTVVNEVPFQPYPHPCLCLWVLISLPSASEQEYYITRWSIWLLAPTGWQSGLSMFFICVWWPCLNSERTVRDASNLSLLMNPASLPYQIIRRWQTAYHNRQPQHNLSSYRPSLTGFLASRMHSKRSRCAGNSCI